MCCWGAWGGGLAEMRGGREAAGRGGWGADGSDASWVSGDIEPAGQCTGEAVGKPSHERNGDLGRTSLNQPYAALSGLKRP